MDVKVKDSSIENGLMKNFIFNIIWETAILL